VQSFPTTDARILAEALPPLRRSSPRVGYTLVLSFMAGGGLGLLFAFAREYMDRRIRTGDQVQEELGVRYLGSLPIGEHEADIWSKGGLGYVDKTTRTECSLLQGARAAADTLRSIIATIDAARGNSRKVIGITSLRAGEGKSTLSFYLARTMAESGK